jgi:sporulation protein YlmC with PRC-barrel domain
MMDKKYLSRDKVVGKEVIDSNAAKVGSVKEIDLALDSKNVALTILTKDGTEIIVEGGNITAVGDVVLLNKSLEILMQPQPEKVQASVPPSKPTTAPTAASFTAPGVCSNCGFQNDPTSKFCVKCGTKLK